MNNHYQKCYEVIGYTFDACVYCPECAPDVLAREHEGVHAIFACDEFYDGAVCDACGEVVVEPMNTNHEEGNTDA